MKKENALMQAFGETLSQYRWEYWLTLTTELPIKNSQVRSIINELLKYLKVPKKASIFWVSEWFSSGLSQHIHALIITGQPKEKLESYWKKRFGLINIVEYDPTKSAAFYIAKYMKNPSNDYDFIKQDNFENYKINKEPTTVLTAGISVTETPDDENKMKQ